jgi:hypothetical protein
MLPVLLAQQPAIGKIFCDLDAGRVDLQTNGQSIQTAVAILQNIETLSSDEIYS